jgi:cytochrome c biogenesis protein CcmG, thiol:disulfide interchange protein DsbE
MNNKLVLGIVGGVLGLAAVIAIAVSAVNPGETDASIAFGEVTVEGTNLPMMPDNPAQDVAMGMTAPTVSGSDGDGNNYTIAPDGRPKVVLFLAHWCPHCQAEVPEVVGWLEAGQKPENVDFYSISTLANRLQGNWPPQKWLADEGWDVPLILDDSSNSASLAYGMRGTPFWIVLDGDNQVMARVPGQVGLSGVTAIFEAAAQSA